MNYKIAYPGHTVALQGVITYGAIAYGAHTIHHAGGTLLVSQHATNGPSFIYVTSGYSGPGTEGQLVVTGVLTNESTISLLGGLSYYGFFGSGAEMLVSGTLHNSGEVFLYGGGFPAGYPSSGTGATLVNSGVVTNSGSIYLEAGGASVKYSNSGALLTDKGVLSNTGNITVGAGRDAYYGAGSQQPATLSVDGSLTNAGTILARGGFFDSVGGQIDVAGAFSNSGTVQLNGGESGSRSTRGAALTLGGVLHNHGQIDIGGGGTVGTSMVPGATLLDRGSLTNNGTIAFTERPGYNPNGVLEIATAGVLHNDGIITGPGTIANYGLISSGAHTSVPNVLGADRLINDGVIEVLPGASTEISGTVSGSIEQHEGSIYIDANASVTCNASSLMGQIFQFNGANAALSVSNLVHFYGELDFARMQPALIDLEGQQVISAVIAPGGYDRSYLDIGYGSGATHALSIAPGSNIPTVSLRSDGKGGTDLLFAPSVSTATVSPGQHGVLSDMPRAVPSAIVDLHPF